MKILITGACGFAGSVLAGALDELGSYTITGVDNLSRPGSETNRRKLRGVLHADLRLASDLEEWPAVDWVIDAAANPSVLAGTKQGCTSRQLFEHNLAGTVNVLEYCKRHRAGLVLLSSSRVYSIEALNALPLVVRDGGFVLDARPLRDGIDAAFSTRPPVSLYGSLKLAAEQLALEYGAAFDFPVWINRCGVLAGAGQFGTPDQGIVSFWIHAHRQRRPLCFIGFGGLGHQVRDIFHPRDLARLIHRQMQCARGGGVRVYSVGGGPDCTTSLAQMHAWCDRRFGPHPVQADSAPRLYDVPWVVMSNAEVQRDFGWTPEIGREEIFAQIAAVAEACPDWLEISGL